MKSSQRPQPLILLVDDEQAALDELTTLLTASGFLCHCCVTPASALGMAEAIVPDLILADVHLQGANGVEVCQQMQQKPALASVPVMFLSSGQTPDIIRRSDGVRGAYYIRKPFDPSVLIGLIDRALGRERLLATASQES